MSAQLQAALRSFITTFVGTLLVAVPIDKAVAGDFSWWKPVVVAAATAAVRTAIAALDPGQPLYGKGAPKAAHQA